jgi:tetratricopeptide (TPR) repeat protein
MFGHWIYKKAAPNSLAQFVTTVAADGLSLGLNATDHLGAPKGREQLVRAIYEAFRSREQPIDYALPPYSPDEVGQWVRHPRQILNPPGQGTCLDLALLFCGACKAFRLLPCLVMLDGHAFAMVSLAHTLDEWKAQSRRERVWGQKPESGGLWRNKDDLLRLFENSTYLPVECTGFARSTSLAETVPEGRGREKGFLPFERAVAAGREQMEPGGRPFLFVLDVPTVQFFWGIGPDETGMAVTTTVAPSRLPDTPGDFIGRDEELKQLVAAWGSAGRTRIVTVVAWGGVGKTALVNRWRATMDRVEGHKPDVVFDWSFYDQGTTATGVGSTEFIDTALRFFGEDDLKQLKSEWARGERLAKLVNRQRTLLILDGLEPLQNPHAPGQLQDVAVQALLRGLVERGPGLCVITTRVPVVELANREPDAVTINLRPLTQEAGAQVLRGLGVLGQDEELEKASAAVDGHALTLQLLGRYLKAAFKPPHVRHSGDILLPLAAETVQGGRATRVIQRYNQWLGEASPESAVLRLVGLFNRRADPKSLSVLRAKPAIPRLTELIITLSDQGWNTTLSHLAELGLVSLTESQSPEDNTPWVDAHPLVREHFAAELQATRPDAWRAGHERLYEYLKGAAPAHHPKSIRQMMPLFYAMGHGCAGGQYLDALRGVYEKRILQNTDEAWLYFSTDVLGQYGASLAALAGLFTEVWHRPVDALGRRDQAFALHEAAVHLRSLGRLEESLRSFLGAVGRYVEVKDWDHASQTARYLGETYTLIGDFGEAETWGEKSVGFSAVTDDYFEKVLNLTSLGDAFHQAGQLDAAERRFLAADEVRDETGQPVPNRFFFWGFGHCELLLTLGRTAEALERARRALEKVDQTQGSVLAIAQIHLALGEALLAEHHVRATDLAPVTTHLELAFSKLVEANHHVHLPRGRLALAELCRVKGDLDASKVHLDAALAVATRDPKAPMRLYQADCYLGYCRLHLARGHEEEARRVLGAARLLIEETNYHRRDSDLRALERML